MMRVLITIERLPASYGPHLLGTDAIIVLASVTGVSGIRIESQHMDSATLSYDWVEQEHGGDGIEQALWSKGMRRVR